MEEKDFKNTVARKIAYYRKKKGLTQSELSEVLHYSDKAVSKWERGESLPDAYVLYQLATYFGITLNDLIADGDPVAVDAGIVRKKFIPVLSVGIAWLAAAVIFFVLILLMPELRRAWLVFIYAIPVSFIVTTVFSCIWYGLLARAVNVSGIVWGIFVSVLLTFPVLKVLYFLIICAVFQVMVILWFIMRYRTSGAHKNTDE